MYHPVTDRTQGEALKGQQPVPRRGDRRRQVADDVGFIVAIDQHGPVGRLRLQARTRADAADLPLHPAFKTGIRDPENLKLQAGRSRVDDEKRIHGYTAATCVARRRAA
ncbi:hypothetical protein D9M70_519880 [compost metagenome]